MGATTIGVDSFKSLGSYSARLTNARLLGDVDVQSDGSTLAPSAVRASLRLYTFRFWTQWSLAALAIVGSLAGVPLAFELVFVALGFSVVMYYLMWWRGERVKILVDVSAIRDVAFGWVWRPGDLFFLGSVFAALSLASASSKTMSFQCDIEGVRTLVVLHASGQRDLVRLAAALDSGLR